MGSCDERRNSRATAQQTAANSGAAGDVSLRRENERGFFPAGGEGENEEGTERSRGGRGVNDSLRAYESATRVIHK